MPKEKKKEKEAEKSMLRYVVHLRYRWKKYRNTLLSFSEGIITIARTKATQNIELFFLA